MQIYIVQPSPYTPRKKNKRQHELLLVTEKSDFLNLVPLWD